MAKLLVVALYLMLCSKECAGQLCCVWRDLAQQGALAESLLTLALDLPSSPPTTLCSDRYVWAPCSNQSSCFTAHCSGSVMGISETVYASTCEFQLDEILSVIRYYGVTVSCTQTPGIFRVPAHSNQTAKLTSKIAAPALSVSTSSTSSLNLSANQPASSTPTSSEPVLTAGVSVKQRLWLGPTNFFENPPPSSRQWPGFVSVNGKLYVFGGEYQGMFFFFFLQYEIASTL